MKSRIILGAGISLVVFLTAYFLFFRSSTYAVYFWIDDAKGLYNRAQVKTGDASIGSVRDVNLYGKRILVKLEISNEVQLPRNTKFYIGTDERLQPCVYTIAGNTTVMLKAGDTVDQKTDSVAAKPKDSIDPNKLPELADSVTRMLEELKGHLK